LEQRRLLSRLWWRVADAAGGIALIIALLLRLLLL
jgi:hypothetical protein